MIMLTLKAISAHLLILVFFQSTSSLQKNFFNNSSYTDHSWATNQENKFGQKLKENKKLMGQYMAGS